MGGSSASSRWRSLGSASADTRLAASWGERGRATPNPPPGPVTLEARLGGLRRGAGRPLEGGMKHFDDQEQAGGMTAALGRALRDALDRLARAEAELAQLRMQTQVEARRGY